MISRRKAVLGATGAATLASLVGCRKEPAPSTSGTAEPVSGAARPARDEEYVLVSANAQLPLFVANDHPALMQAARELGVRATIAGPNSVDIPALVAALEQTAARKPAGIMVNGWDPSALVAPINEAIDNGIPVVCVDADVPASKRIAFIGTDWTEVGVRQAQVMVKALNGRKGRIAMLGIIEEHIDQLAFAGFRSVAEKAGLTIMEPQQDKGSQSEAVRVASDLIQAHPDLVGMAGFDSESGSGIGQAIREAGKIGAIVGTCVDADPRQLRYIKDGILTACVGQKRALFTYQGLKTLYELAHPSLKITSDDHAAGISPVPVYYNTGTFLVTRDNVDLVLKGTA
jgi:ABC-type sugar transport system substrate-binding protein